MTAFTLDQRLAADCHELTVVEDTHILLMNNRLIPWLILVPHTPEIELHRLNADTFAALMTLQHQCARFIESQFSIDKINIGAIGNIVSQLHVHIIGRRKTDPYWPGVVWGNPTREPYTPEQVTQLQTALQDHLQRPL
ncbi:MAG: HIT family protein [Deltaproteobacteria bacterium]|nr:HIT family protein [Deltaproteobacteria bacterium]MBN2673196.1 HIT family protein [Deltaproteobacteria bacterium]